MTPSPDRRSSSRPPLARRDDGALIEQHGRTRHDPYAWLRDDNWREVMRDPFRLRQDIRAYLESENAFTRDHLEAPLAQLQDDLFQEMRGRINETDATAPDPDGPFAYYRRFREGGEYPIYCRRPAEQAFDGDLSQETLLIDGDALAAGCDYFDIRNTAHSPDHRFIAYAVDDKGSEFYTIHVLEAETGQLTSEVIPDSYGAFCWAPDGASLFWVARDQNARPIAVYRRMLGSGEDRLVYRESDAGFFVGVHACRSGRFVFITSNDHATSEWHFLEAGKLDEEPRLIAAREPNVDYSAVFFDGRFWIRSNWDKAVDFGLWSAPVETPSREHWRLECAHRPGVLILGLDAAETYLARMERENGLPRIVIRDRAGSEHVIAFEGEAYAIGMLGGYEWNTTRLRFEFSSPSTPAQVFDYDVADRTRVLRKQQIVPSGHDPSRYVVERLDAPAPDGALVPIILIRRADLALDGNAPVLLYGYGSYGITIPAEFRTARLSLVDRGMIFATADVRGSMAKGYDWYLQGKLAAKTNSFTDFVAAGRHLVEAGYTQPRRIIAMGGSAGGMLVGAAVNLDPELFGGVVAAVPFVDVLNTMSDESLPLTPPEWPEWGDPIRDPEAYERIAAYAPYEQTANLAYPPMLVTGGLTDPRVTYWEPAKWVAKLRHEAPNAGPYFLRINMDAGHGGVSGRFASLKETALEYAFALAAGGLAPSSLFSAR